MHLTSVQQVKYFVFSILRMNVECFLKTCQSNAWQRKRKEFGILVVFFSVAMETGVYIRLQPRKSDCVKTVFKTGLCSLACLHLHSCLRHQRAAFRRASSKQK